jgi:hypothetical protein
VNTLRKGDDDDDDDDTLRQTTGYRSHKPNKTFTEQHWLS